MKKENYLERKPKRCDEISWSKEGEIVTLAIENKGFMNRVFQKLLKKPAVSYVHLDEVGSFVWQIMDGETDIICLGKKVKEQFGEKAEPLYERLVKYFQILESYRFIKWN